jgi:hypothetical protein
VSLTVAGLAALGVAASRKHESYLRGSDVLGTPFGDVEPHRVKVVAESPVGMTYWTSVAAGLTVVAVWTIFSKMLKVK